MHIDLAKYYAELINCNPLYHFVVLGNRGRG